MLFARLPLVLLLSGLISAAAIPSSHTITSSNSESSASSEWLAPGAASLSPPTQSSNDGTQNHLAKRRPYYFPETVPDEEEIAARLASLRETGYLQDAQEQQGQNQKSIGTPDAAIDTARARPAPIQELTSALSERNTPPSIWDATMPALYPAAWFFAFASVVICVVTVIRGVSDADTDTDADTYDKGKH